MAKSIAEHSDGRRLKSIARSRRCGACLELRSWLAARRGFIRDLRNNFEEKSDTMAADVKRRNRTSKEINILIATMALSFEASLMY